MRIRSWVVASIYLSVFATGVSLWTHHLGWAIINSGCVLWNLFSLEMLNKQEDK